MTSLLRVDSSARVEGSHSRELADFFQETWLKQFPDTTVVVRDVALSGIPHVDNLTLAGFMACAEDKTPEMKAAIALSETLIAELTAADILLFSIPMYNFSIPSSLKAWIDQIVREGKTFAVDETGYRGLLTAKRAYLLSASGADGYQEGGPMASLNFLNPYMKGLLNFLGVQDVKSFVLQGMMADAAAKNSIIAEVKAEVEKAIAAAG